MISAKSVRTNNTAQGNTCNPRSAMKLHHRTQENNRVGGTMNLTRAIYASPSTKLCKVAKGPIDEHVWQNGVMVRTNVKPSVSYTTIETPATIDIGQILRRSERLEMTPIQYCVYIGYTPNDQEFAELLEYS